MEVVPPSLPLVSSSFARSRQSAPIQTSFCRPLACDGLGYLSVIFKTAKLLQRERADFILARDCRGCG